MGLHFFLLRCYFCWFHTEIFFLQLLAVFSLTLGLFNQHASHLSHKFFISNSLTRICKIWPISVYKFPHDQFCCLWHRKNLKCFLVFDNLQQISLFIISWFWNISDIEIKVGLKLFGSRNTRCIKPTEISDEAFLNFGNYSQRKKKFPSNVPDFSAKVADNPLS